MVELVAGWGTDLGELGGTGGVHGRGQGKLMGPVDAWRDWGASRVCGGVGGPGSFGRIRGTSGVHRGLGEIGRPSPHPGPGAIFISPTPPLE